MPRLRRRIPVTEFNEIFDAIRKRWILITAGNLEDCNAMTANWGGIGILWRKEVSFIFIRPTRHTFIFVEKEKYFTISFFEEKYRGALEICGTKSGKDHDKITESGLTAMEIDGSVAFEEAEQILVCRKIYYDDLEPTKFLDPEIEGIHYPNKDYHRLYVGEIVSAYR